MDQQTLSKLKQIFQQADSLGIIVGANPTVDEMGAALALYLSLKTAGKKASIAALTEPIVELSSLVGIDQVRNSLGGSTAGDLVVSFPYKEGEIEKVSYTLENGYLNIVVKAGELGLNFADDDVRFTRGAGGAPSVLVTIGVPRLSDIEPLMTDEMRTAQIVNIDTNPQNEGYGDVAIVSPRMSSQGEQMAELILSANMPLDVDMAQNLLSGISFATGNFQDPKTSFLAFEMAGELMRLGAMRVAPVMPTPQQRASIPQPRTQTPRYPAMNPDYNQVPQPRVQPRPQPQRPMPQMPGGSRPQGGQRMPQPMGGQQRPQPQPQAQPRPQGQNMAQSSARSRQDEIREELARAAQMGQQTPMSSGQAGTSSYDEPMDTQAQPQQSNGRSKNPPADWLTPKVYKGSSDVNN
jgi:hypothetical protein